MSDFLIDAVIETTDGRDWPVHINYDVDRGVNVLGVFNTDEESGCYDHWPDLTDNEKRQAKEACEMDYDWRCREAEAMSEDPRA